MGGLSDARPMTDVITDPNSGLQSAYPIAEQRQPTFKQPTDLNMWFQSLVRAMEGYSPQMIQYPGTTKPVMNAPSAFGYYAGARLSPERQSSMDAEAQPGGFYGRR